MVDRCLVAAYDAALEPLLVLTKADRRPGPTSSTGTRRSRWPTSSPVGTTAESAVSRSCTSGCRATSPSSSATPASARAPSSTPSSLTPTAIGDVNVVTGRGRHVDQRGGLRLPDGDGWVIDTPGALVRACPHRRRPHHRPLPRTRRRHRRVPPWVHARRGGVRARRLGGQGPRRTLRSGPARVTAPTAAESLGLGGVLTHRAARSHRGIGRLACTVQIVLASVNPTPSGVCAASRVWSSSTGAVSCAM